MKKLVSLALLALACGIGAFGQERVIFDGPLPHVFIGGGTDADGNNFLADQPVIDGYAVHPYIPDDPKRIVTVINGVEFSAEQIAAVDEMVKRERNDEEEEHAKLIGERNSAALDLLSANERIAQLNNLLTRALDLGMFSAGQYAGCLAGSRPAGLHGGAK